VSRHLRVYMNDQLAAGILWREFAWRAQRENAGTPLGDALVHVAEITTEDVELFRTMMNRLGLRENPLKVRLAIASERLSRLKSRRSGRASYSPLSRFEELDFLLAGVTGKKILWQNLGDHAGLQRRLADIDFDQLMRRAQEQIDTLSSFHAEAAREALRA
jgi:hypothetical protein